MARIQGLTISRGNRGLLILALITGLVAAIVVFVALNQGGGGSDNAKPGSAVTTTSAVVVAKSDIAAGTEITAGMVEVIEAPNSLLVRDAFTSTQLVVGETARYPIAAGEQVTRARVGPKTEGDGLAFVVPAGMPVPVTVRVDKVNPKLEVLYYETLTLERKDDERTALRFTVLSNGQVTNINHIAKSLVAKAFKRG